MSTTSSTVKLIPLEERETVKLLQGGFSIEAAFGTGGMALKWDTSKPMTPTVKQLLLMRGILNENMDGLGI